jgi:hypothetical protein
MDPAVLDLFDRVIGTLVRLARPRL